MAPLKFERALADFLFPPVCLSCGGNISKKEGGLCDDCRKVFERRFEPHSFLCRDGNRYADSMFTLFPYRCEEISQFLFNYKRAAYEDNSRVFEEYASRALPLLSFTARADLVSFAPRSRQNLAKTFIDQSEDMAKIFSRISGIPFEDLLKRHGFSFTQHSRKGASRQRNVRGRFRARRFLNGESVILLDDIVTTGSSASEAARTLKEAGAMHVYVLSFAH